MPESANEPANGSNTSNSSEAKQPSLPVSPFKDSDGNEIRPWGKTLAGILLILFTVFTGLYLVGHWPDRLPSPENITMKPLYTYHWFHVTLVDTIPKKKPSKDTDAESLRKVNDSLRKLNDSLKAGITDTSLKYNSKKDTLVEKNDAATPDCHSTPECELIDINTLLLILVAVAGFLGNMIHLATSFTTFIGAGKFKSSWLLWYTVKPFTASGLAIAIYFVFRGGFLNMSSDSASINLYGVMTISLLAGLFTDRATMKLKEVFDVLLRPKEERPDALENNDPKITGIKADLLEVGKPIPVVLTGANLATGKIDILIEGQPAESVNRKSDSIEFTYTLPEALKDKTEVSVTVKLEKDKEPLAYSLKIKPAGGNADATNQTNENDSNTISNAGDIVPDGPDEEEGNEPIVKE